MKKSTIKTAKQAMIKLQEAIELLEKVKGDNENIDHTAHAIGFAFGDLKNEIENDY